MLNSEQKQEKRKSIAKSTCSLFIEKGYVNITINEIAKVAGIGKGTVYEYFKNKEDIIFELMACLQNDYDFKLEKKLHENISAKIKVLYLFDIFLSENETVQIQRKIYKEFLSIYINNKTEAMYRYEKNMMDKYSILLEKIFYEAIQKEELPEISLTLIPSIFATLKGFFITSDDKEQIVNYLDSLFLLFKNSMKEE